MIIRLQARKGISSVIGALHVFVTVYLAKIAEIPAQLIGMLHRPAWIGQVAR